MIDIREFSDQLRSIEDGIWTSNRITEVSWPRDGHDTLFNIEAASVWFQHRNNCILEIMKSYPPAGPLFDIGGGNGFISMNLRAHGFETVIVEPTPEGIQNAKYRNLKPIIFSSLTEAHFKEASLPAIGLFDVIEHIENDIHFLESIKKVLRKEGRLYITAPAFNCLRSSKDDYVGHYRRYAIKDLIQKLRQTGFTIDYATYIFSLLVLPVFFLRALPKKLGIQGIYTPEKHKQDHLTIKGIFQRVIRPVLKIEMGLIRQRKKIPFGYSCLIVATSL